MKYSTPILAGLALALGGGVLVANAAISSTYTPLAQLPGTLIEGTATTDLPTYLTGAIKLIIASAGAIAVVMLVIGGTQYVAAGINPSAKSDAKERIWNAIIGLILVLTSYLILASIDRRLVQFNLTLPAVGGISTEPSAITATPTPTMAGQPWPSDAPERAELGATPYRITVNRSPGCTIIGQPSCTSLAGLGSGAKQGLKALATSCGASCRVQITGGTEYWLHGNKSTDRMLNSTSHGAGNNVVDLAIGNSTTLDNYIRNTGTVISSGCSSGIRYKIGGVIYVDERIAGNPPHWHVCY